MPHSSVPAVVVKCVEYLRGRGMHMVGIFRFNVAKTDIMNLWKALEAKDSDLSDVDDPHVVAGLLKLYLRKQPETPLRYDHVAATKLSTGAATSPSSDIAELQSVVQRLTPSQYHLLYYLMRFLHDLSLDDDVNEMSVHDLTQFFAPLLCRPDGSAHMSVLHIKALSQIKRFTQILIEEHVKVFLQSPTPRKSPRQKLKYERSPMAGGSPSVHGSHAREILKTLIHESISSFFKAQSSPPKAISPRRLQRANNMRTCHELQQSVDTLKAQPQPSDDGPGCQALLRRKSGEYKKMRRVIRGEAATTIQSLLRGIVVRSEKGEDGTERSPPGRRKKGATSKEGVTSITSTTSTPAAAAASPAKADASAGSPEGGQGVVNSIQWLCALSLPRLCEEKKKIKYQLKQFDAKFLQCYGRKPGKMEKEPMRTHYERYNDIKLLIDNKESPVIATRLGVETDTIGQQLALEKHLLQRKLRRFETTFEHEHGRKVRMQKDIEPVATEYHRYKELKLILRKHTAATGGASMEADINDLAM